MNKASKAAKFVKKGAKGKLLKKRFSATFHRCDERREWTMRMDPEGAVTPRDGGMARANDATERLTMRTRDAIQAAHLEART